MNQKDYKAIAEILKFFKTGRNSIIENHDKVVNKLADYFEQEDKTIFMQSIGDKFNREQFLKDCGVQNG